MFEIAREVRESPDPREDRTAGNADFDRELDRKLDDRLGGDGGADRSEQLTRLRQLRGELLAAKKEQLLEQREELLKRKESGEDGDSGEDTAPHRGLRRTYSLEEGQSYRR